METAIRAVYRGPLEEFIRRRDALAKQLRTSKRRDDADRVKGFRKPSRTAWALDQVALDDRALVEQLADAITAAQEMQSSGGGRAVMENVRAAVRALAEGGAQAAARLGHPIESAVLVAPVRAVIGDANAFADLRAGCLAEIPEGGGLDILTAVNLAGPATPKIVESGTKAETRADDAVAAARAELLHAEAALRKARERAEAAQRTVLTAQAKLEAAEQQLLRAQEEADARRLELERARQDAESAATQVADAERAVAELSARIE
jgi:hypothetical protein